MSEGEGEGGLPVVDPDGVAQTDVDASGGDDPRVAGVLLAAGTSSRFGDENKLLATVDGHPLVRHAARTLQEADIDPLVVVVGHQRERVEAALTGVDCRLVVNEAFAEGQATSVRAGVEALEPDVDAAVFALGDMPFVESASIRALVDVYRSTAWTALAAAFEGVRGNPVLFDRSHFSALADVSGDRGGREILRSGDGVALVETGDPGVRRDVDTRADLRGTPE